MSVIKPVRKTRDSRKHLATDFNWEGLEALTLPTADELFHDLCKPQLDAMQAPRLSAFSSPGEDTSLDSRLRTNDGKDLGKVVHRGVANLTNVESVSFVGSIKVND